LQQDVAEDYVIATGVTTKVRDFIIMAFAHIGFHLRWEGEGVDEVGILDSVNIEKYQSATGQMLNGQRSTFNDLTLNESTGNDFNDLLLTVQPGDILVKVDPRYFRPTEVDLLIGDPTKSNTKLGWKPEYDLAGLVEDMMVSDIKLFKKDIHLVEKGHLVLKRAE
jgi:GDPmannose 4,6-dehydratase